MAGYIVIGGILFSIGLYGLLIRPSMIRMFIAIEIMIAGINLVLVALLAFSGESATDAIVQGQTTSSGLVLLFFVWLFAIANAAVGLPLILLIRRKMGVDSSSELRSLHG
ncbi:MAG: NADH-quinone oxidoreductase subunit K [Parcubacteria group bacterium GW2011_GWA2_47_10]|nr:MAG: NADH-quinone oxidoreductase subunit K [Parcubacteria group bacterium GW2011_GWA2_47_10]